MIQGFSELGLHDEYLNAVETAWLYPADTDPGGDDPADVER